MRIQVSFRRSAVISSFMAVCHLSRSADSIASRNVVGSIGSVNAMVSKLKRTGGFRIRSFLSSWSCPELISSKVLPLDFFGLSSFSGAFAFELGC